MMTVVRNLSNVCYIFYVFKILIYTYILFFNIYFICILLSFSPLYLYSLKCCLVLSYLIFILSLWGYDLIKYVNICILF